MIQRKKLILIKLIMTLFIGVGIGYVIASTQQGPVTQRRLEKGPLKTVYGSAFSQYDLDNNKEIVDSLIFMIKFPSSYFATSANLFTYYRSQGGGGWPLMVLTKGEQFTNPHTTESEGFRLLHESGISCIKVFPNPATLIPGIDNNEDGTNGIFVGKTESYKGDRFVFKIRETHVSDTPQTKRAANDAFTKLKNGVIYYFETCNRKNKEDLKTVLKYFNIRQDF